MRKRSSNLQGIEKAIKKLSPEEQQQLLAKLLKMRNISMEDAALLDAAESAFAFWDNPEDSVYDSL